jgi:DNA-binding NtrC family response regulator
MSAFGTKVGHPVSRDTIKDLPPIQQRSVEELIDRNLLEHKRGMGEILDRFQNTVVIRALELRQGNITHAAAMLQVTRTTLVAWMDKFGLRQSVEGEDQP